MNRRNFDKLMTEQLRLHPTVLLHACCGPCATAAVDRLKDECDLTLYWYNPNIMPLSEHELRKENLRTVAEHFAVPLLMEEGYPIADFVETARGYEDEEEGGRRCTSCFVLRLTQTAKRAKREGFEYFCTTLTVSSRKDADLINTLGEQIAAQEGVKWLYSDFKKKDGNLRSIKLSEELGLYRQMYCGCAYGRQGEN